MENDLRRGDLVEVSAVRERWDAVAGIVKRRLLAISSKLAPRLLRLRSPAEVRTIIDSEVYTCGPRRAFLGRRERTARRGEAVMSEQVRLPSRLVCAVPQAAR